MAHTRGNMNSNNGNNRLLDADEEAALRAEHYALIRSLQRTGNEMQMHHGKGSGGKNSAGTQRGILNRGPVVTSSSSAYYDHPQNHQYEEPQVLIPDHRTAVGTTTMTGAKKGSLLLSSMTSTSNSTTTAAAATTTDARSSSQSKLQQAAAAAGSGGNGQAEMSLDASPSDNGNDAADDEEMEEEDEIDDDEEDFDDRRIDDYERLNNSRSAGQRGNVSHSAAAAAAHLAQQQENQRRSSAAAIAYSRALRSAGGAGGGSSSVAVTNPLDDPPPLYGQYLSTRVTGNPNVTTSATNESVSWNPASSSSSSSTHKVTPISHYQTLDRTTTDSGVKLNNQLLRNNLLSSSVRDLLSSTLSHDRSQASYAALNRDNGNRAEYESAGTTCLVRTQSGSRFIFPTEMIETTTSSLVDHTSILMRPGITTSRTIGSKINRRPVVGPSSTFNSFQSRIGKSLNVNLNWRCTSMVLLVICITLFLSLIYSLSRTFDCSCSPALMIEDGSADGSSSSSGSNSNSNQILSVPGASVSISCPVLCSGRGQYVKGSCTCNEGWKGRECNIRSDQCDSPNCSNHGSCINGRCQCVPGFKGSNCDQDQCPLLCSGRGQYLKGSCLCSSGWKGKECELRKDQCDPVDCNRHGNCVEGDCVCRPGWKGPACDLSTSLCDVSDCNGRGSCRSGMCDCRPGFKGIHCEITDCLDPNCSGHGSCFEGRCICKPGWMGNNCSSVDQRFGKHFPNCSSRGVFDIETERCSCFSGFTGDRCDIDRCNTDCGPHGSCEGSACICSTGWIGDRCEIKTCDQRCLSNGKCQNGTCTCNPGFYGKHCSLNGCPSSCSGHGECERNEGDNDGSEFEWSSEFVCRCKSGWTGLDCSHELEINCNDNLDNDNDGLIDCADSECCSRPECRESLMCLTSPEPLDILLRKPPPSVTASFYQKMKFLIDEGSVQSYAHRDEYSESRVSVIRGRVVTPDANGLTGIRISVATDPQFGFTLTRPDGWFDILVNGGSMVTLQFQRSPFHPIKRTVLVPWNEIVVIQSPIVMAAGADSDQQQFYSFSPATAAILSSASFPAASADDPGFLSSLLRTSATASDPLIHGNAPSGSSSSFHASHLRSSDAAPSSSSSQMHHRINGSALPPPSPASSSVSSSSPSGSAMTASAAAASLICTDHNYDGMKPRLMEHAASASIPSSLQPSSSSSSSSSAPSSSSSSSSYTFSSSASSPNSSPGSSSSHPTQESAGIGESQILAESLTIPGSGIRLMYRSSFAAGFLSTIHLQLTSGSSLLPASLKLIHVRIIVEGNLFSKLLEPDPDLRFTYAWNKRNVYRQKVYGLTTAKVYIGYEYSSCRHIIWSTLTTTIRGFDMEVSDLGSWNLDIHHRYNYHQGVLQKGDGSAVFFKQQSRIVHLLIGSEDRSARSPNCPANECEGPAKAARLSDPIALTSGPDGSVYVGDGNIIRRITPEGYVITVFKISSQSKLTRNGVNGGAGSNSPASQSAGSGPGSGKNSNPASSSSSSSHSSSYNYHIQLSQYDNHLYVADPERHQILRIHTIDRVEDPESNYDIFVGSGSRCLPRDPQDCGDSGSALEAKLSFPKGMAFTLDGSLYFADGNSIRMVNRRGHIHTVIGSGNSYPSYRRRNQWQPIPCGGSIAADQVTLRWPTELAMHPIDGTLYFLDDQMVLRLLPDQRVTVVAGLPSYCKSVARGGGNNAKQQTGNQVNEKRSKQHQDDQEEEDQQQRSSTRKTSSSRNRKQQQPSQQTADIGAVLSFAFSFSGDLYVAAVDDEGMHRVSLIRDSKGRQEVIHFFGASRHASPGSRSSSSSPSSSSLHLPLCEVETCRDLEAHNCSCALASQEILTSFTGVPGKISLAQETAISSITAITVTPDGVVHVADDSALQVLSAVPFIPGPDENLLFSMTSPGSNELYIFNKYGQHVFTKNVITNQVLYTFVYDVDTSFGKLSAVTDVKGSRVSFLRDSSRSLASVETSAGLKCRVTVNAQSFLETFVDPENLTSRFFYETSTGLMTTRRDSSGFNLFYKYDANGRLVGVIADSF